MNSYTTGVKPIRIRSTDSQFPTYLREIPKPPKEIYLLGDIGPMLTQPRLAVVGTRKVTPYGRYVTTKLAGETASRGVAIISGLALGVDAIAHKAALDSGGATLAVLASGLDQITPASNFYLGKRILEQGGAIISEYPPGTPARPEHFIARNRLVSGISDAVLITEAAGKSGTMHTANFALDQGKTVLAVPGNINSPLSEGTNNLIKSGAVPVTAITDILHALDLPEAGELQQQMFGNTQEETIIINLLQQGVSDSAQLLARSHLVAAVFSQSLTMLEISGKIRSLGAGHWALN